VNKRHYQQFPDMKPLQLILNFSFPEGRARKLPRRTGGQMKFFSLTTESPKYKYKFVPVAEIREFFVLKRLLVSNVCIFPLSDEEKSWN
jgi:hypothetical protein